LLIGGSRHSRPNRRDRCRPSCRNQKRALLVLAIREGNLGSNRKHCQDKRREGPG
jgi:hypothetical protein